MFKAVYCIGEHEKTCVAKITMRKKNASREECRLIISRMESMRFSVQMSNLLWTNTRCICSMLIILNTFQKSKVCISKFTFHFHNILTRMNTRSNCLQHSRRQVRAKCQMKTFIHNFEQIRVTKIMLSKIVIIFV